MVIVLTVVVSETVLLVIVCNCVHCSLLFSSIFVLHSLRIKVCIWAYRVYLVYLCSHMRSQPIYKCNAFYTFKL